MRARGARRGFIGARKKAATGNQKGCQRDVEKAPQSGRGMETKAPQSRTLARTARKKVRAIAAGSLLRACGSIRRSIGSLLPALGSLREPVTGSLLKLQIGGGGGRRYTIFSILPAPGRLLLALGSLRMWSLGARGFHRLAIYRSRGKSRDRCNRKALYDAIS